MTIHSEREHDGPGARQRLVIVLLSLLVVVAAAVWFFARPRPEPPKAPARAPRARASASPRARPAAPVPDEGAAPRAEPKREASLPRLRVDADVAGANVFLDRRFLGTTPVETRDFAPGTHRLNASAEGYEMYAETIDLDAASRDVMIRFKEVRLDERVDVVHKHAVGSCRGRLLASTAGLRYEADEAGESFEAAFASLEPLQVDYLKKSLRVKRHGGKTWNFTGASADALLTFQQAVEKARKRL